MILTCGLWASRSSSAASSQCACSQRLRSTAKPTMLAATHGCRRVAAEDMELPDAAIADPRASSASIERVDLRIVEPGLPVRVIAVGTDERNDNRSARRIRACRGYQGTRAVVGSAGRQDRRDTPSAESREHVGDRIHSGSLRRCSANGRRRSATARRPAPTGRDSRAAGIATAIAATRVTQRSAPVITMSPGVLRREFGTVRHPAQAPRDLVSAGGDTANRPGFAARRRDAGSHGHPHPRPQAAAPLGSTDAMARLCPQKKPLPRDSLRAELRYSCRRWSRRCP